MMRKLTLLVLLWGSASPLYAQDLVSRIEQTINTPPFDKATWGIRIEEEDGRLLFEHNSEKLMTPASNRKMLSTVFADSCLPYDRRLATEFWLAAKVSRGVLRGDLVVVGDGDPSFAGRFQADRDDVLRPLLERLRRIGVRRIDGNVVADVSLFARDTLPGSWKNDNLWSYYAAPVDALAYNENAIGTRVSGDCNVTTVTTDPAFVPASADVACGEATAIVYERRPDNSVHVQGTAKRDAVLGEGELLSAFDPALYFAQGVRDFLERNGIAVRGVRVSPQPAERIDRILVIESLPMAELTAVVLETSQNLYTEMLFKRAAAEGQATPVTYEDALAAERRFLTTSVGLSDSDFYFRDGSGLSPDNLVTPHALLRVVRYMMEPSRRGRFLNVMERPGGIGTLRNRLLGLEDVVRAKTGFINQTAALSGVVRRPDGSLRYFSIVVNHYASGAGREPIDAIVRIIAE